MKAKVNVALALCSMTIGLSLVMGSVFAAFSITDDANMLGVRVGLLDTVLVRFMNIDNTVNKSQYVVAGEKLSSETIPSDPTLDGYVFDGWTTNTSTYEVTTDNFATKTYSTSVTYYPRFASYGYKVGSEDATHLNNTWDINNNIDLAKGSSLTLGTYIYGKATLENATSAVTIPNAGGYALVCGDHASRWDSSKADTLSNWHIQRYIDVTKTSDWDNFKLFARVNKANDVYEDKGLSLIENNSYYFYADYDALSVNFVAINNIESSVPTSLDSAAKHLDAITLSDTTSYTLPATAYYLTGSFGSVDWGFDANYLLTQNPTDSTIYSIENVALNAGDKIKIKTNAYVWYSNSSEWGPCTLDGDGNMVISRDGIYKVDFHTDWNDKIALSATSLESTFTVTYDGLGSNESIYVAGLDGDWSIKDANKLLPVQGQANTYSANIMVSNATELFKYVVSGGASDDWDTLNPDGNRTYSLGGNYSYTYSPTVTTRTIDIYHKYVGSESWWHSSSPVWGVFAYTSSESDGKYYLANYIESYNNNEDHLQVTIDDTCTKLKVLRCDPAQVDGDGVPTAESVWNQTGYFDITSNTYLNTWY